MKKRQITRRNFIQKTAVTTGVFSVGIADGYGIKNLSGEKLPGEVWIASFSQMGLEAESSGEMVDKVLKHLENILVYKPDIICLPEVFPFWGVKKDYAVSEFVEESKYALSRLAEFSQKNNCYSIGPVYTSENGKVYNAAVIFDRNGNKTGEYRKAHPTEDEIAEGITPGPVFPPVFQTDFGRIGVQICFDLLWDDSWTALREEGADIVFFASAFPGGQMINAKAWQHKYVVVSSTCKHVSKICDISGEVIAQTGIWDANLICAPVNIEKAFLHLYPYYKRFDEIKQRFGRKISISIFHEEEWAIIESLSPEIKVKNIIEEYELKTHEELIRGATIEQDKARNQYE